MMFRVLFAKEMTEQWRTHRVLILVSVLLALGLASPLIAKLSPELVKGLASSRPGVVITLPPPTLADSLGQYIKNISQFGALTVILLGLSAVAGEKSRGTALLTLSRAAGRGTFLAAKLCAQSSVLAGSMLLAASGCYTYSSILFGPPPLGPFLAINALLGLFLMVIEAMTMLASTLTRNVSTAAALACIGAILLVIAGTLPVTAAYTPSGLIAWANRLATGGGTAPWAAVGAGILMIPVLVLAALLRFRREEL